MTATIPLPFGADLLATVTWPDGAGGVADLTDCTVEVLRPSALLSGRLSAAISDAAAGRITLQMTWVDALGANRLPLRFSLRVTPPSGPRQASALIGIKVV
jgi:hypothetical protein